METYPDMRTQTEEEMWYHKPSSVIPNSGRFVIPTQDMKQEWINGLSEENDGE